MKNLKIDTQKKEELHENYLKSRIIMYMLPRFLAWFGIISSLIFYVLCQVNEEWFLVYNITSHNYGEKDMIMIWGILLCNLAIFLFLSFISKIAIWRISGIQLSERVNESMSFSEGEFVYAYQKFAGSVSGDRIAKRIPLDEQTKITYNRKLEKIIFTGTHYSTYYSNYARKVINKGPETVQGEFILFDYFKPSLLEVIKSEGLRVEEI